jgi:hypothetical protein
MKQTNEGSRRSFLQVSSALGLAVAFSLERLGEAFANSISASTRQESNMTQTSGTQRGSERADAIRPFHVNVPETELAELRRRVKAWEQPELFH